MYYTMIIICMALMTIALFLVFVLIHMRNQRQRSLTVRRRGYYRRMKKRALRNKQELLDRILTEAAKQRVKGELILLCYFNGRPFYHWFPPNFKMIPLIEVNGVCRPRYLLEEHLGL